MSRPAVFVIATISAIVMLTTFGAPDARAVIQFKREFERKYVDPDSRSPNARRFAAVTRKAKCFVCHLDEDKKLHNAYGRALAELLDKDEDKDNREKIRAALEKVAQMSSDPSSEDAPTFGEIIESGRLPSGYRRVAGK